MIAPTTTSKDFLNPLKGTLAMAFQNYASARSSLIVCLRRLVAAGFLKVGIGFRAESFSLRVSVCSLKALGPRFYCWFRVCGFTLSEVQDDNGEHRNQGTNS